MGKLPPHRVRDLWLLFGVLAVFGVLVLGVVIHARFADEQEMQARDAAQAREIQEKAEAQKCLAEANASPAPAPQSVNARPTAPVQIVQNTPAPKTAPDWTDWQEPDWREVQGITECVWTDSGWTTYLLVVRSGTDYADLIADGYALSLAQPPQSYVLKNYDKAPR